MRRWSDLILILLVLAAGCRRENSRGTAVARIEDRTLTMQDIRARFDSSHVPTESQLQQYLQRWIADELLYREAVRRGLDQEPDVVRRAEDLRRQAVIQALLDREIYNSASTTFTDEEIRQYFETHKQEFTVSETVALISTALFSDRERATEVRNEVLQGSPWRSALASHAGSGSMLGRTDSVYVTEARLWPRELWRVSTTIAPGTPSFPINTQAGYYLVQVWKVLKPGTAADPAYVRNEIVTRLTTERRQRAYRSLVENLRAGASVDIYISPTFGDTLTNRDTQE